MVLRDQILYFIYFLRSLLGTYVRNVLIYAYSNSFAYMRYIYICVVCSQKQLWKKHFQNLFKVLFSAAIEYLEKLIKEFFLIKMDRNSPSCRSLTEVALSGSRSGCCTLSQDVTPTYHNCLTWQPTVATRSNHHDTWHELHDVQSLQILHEGYE